MDPIATRPQSKREALDQALAEAVARVKNDPATAGAAFEAMRDTLLASPSVELCRDLLKKLVATALSSWTPPTADPEAFAAVAKRAGFDVVIYGAGKHPGPAVVREPGYPSTTGPLLRSVCRAFATTVLAPVHAHLAAGAPGDAFVASFAELLRTGSAEAPSTPKSAPAPRFALD